MRCPGARVATWRPPVAMGDEGLHGACTIASPARAETRARRERLAAKPSVAPRVVQPDASSSIGHQLVMNSSTWLWNERGIARVHQHIGEHWIIQHDDRRQRVL